MKTHYYAPMNSQEEQINVFTRIWDGRMKILLLCTVVLTACAVAVSAQEQPSETDPLSTFLEKGKMEAKVGVAVNDVEMRDTDTPSAGISWALAELGYTTTADFWLQGGIHAIMANKLWENHSGEYESAYVNDLDLRDLYLTVAPPNIDSSFTLGRRKFSKNPSMDGDSHQGAQFTVDDIPTISLTGCAIERWIKHDTTFMDADGISGWDAVDDIGNDAGDVFYASTLTWTLSQNISVAPFISYQQDVMTVYGASAAVSIPVAEGLSWGFNAVGAVYGNEVPKHIEPDYEDVQSYNLHTSVAGSMGHIGVGWWAVSDNRGDITVGMFNAFDPMEEDDLYPFDDRNNAAEFYIDGHAKMAAFSMDFAVSIGQNDALDSYTREVDCWLYYDITTHMQLGGYVAWTDYETDEMPSYTQMGSSLTYSF